MLVESGIPVTPLKQSHTPDTKHMAPATNDMCSHLCHANDLVQLLSYPNEGS